MALANWSELKADVISATFRQGDSEFAAYFPTLVTLCEKRIADEIELGDQQTNATVTITSGVGPLPSGFLYAERVLDLTNPHELTESTLAQVGDKYVNDGSGYANDYVIVGSNIQVFPTATTSLSVDYYATFTPLTEAAPTNWLLTKAPHLYLYGCLLDASPYMMDDARAQIWGAAFANALNRMKRRDKLKRFARAQVRVAYKTP